jgi:hypothetical protein
MLEAGLEDLCYKYSELRIKTDIASLMQAQEHTKWGPVLRWSSRVALAVTGGRYRGVLHVYHFLFHLGRPHFS